MMLGASGRNVIILRKKRMRFDIIYNDTVDVAHAGVIEHDCDLMRTRRNEHR